MIQIWFYKAANGTLFDKTIAAWTKGPYSHVEIHFVSIDQCFSASPRDGGTRFKRIPISDHWTVIDLPDIDEKNVIKWCMYQLGKPYDWAGVFGLGIGVPTEHKHKWYCSEIVSFALNWFQVKFLPLSISPNELHRLLT